MSPELVVAAQEILGDFEKSWSFDTRDLERPSADATLRSLVARSQQNIRTRLESEFFADGPLTELLADPDIQEILVNGPSEIWFEKSGALHALPDRFLSETTFKNFIDRLCSEAQLKIDLAQPFVDGRWRGFRVHLGCAPLTHCQFHLSLRRLPENPWTLASLRAADWCTDAQLRGLKDLLTARSNILFIGPTGCGKTTVLGACLKELPVNERVVILEDTDELPRPNLASTKMLTRTISSTSLPEVSLTDLVRQSLRMRPQRLVMGEVRGGEAKDLLLALATGHSGSLGTLHASEARQALIRLEMLVQLGAPQWNTQAIRQLIQLSVEALVVCGFEGGRRRLHGLFKVAALESCGFLLDPIA
jgi:pilus assembly protein CpaF